MLRRIAITLAATTAAGFLAVGTASAAPMGHSAQHDAGGWASGEYSHTGGNAGFEAVNLGGPWGITKVSGHIAGHHNTGAFDLGGFEHDAIGR
jgi:hypothetical protein